jgi:hypothetical protein
MVSAQLEAWSRRPKSAQAWSRIVSVRGSRSWRAFGLQRHRQDASKLSKNPLFIDKVRDVVFRYLDPPERAVATPNQRSRARPVSRH